MSLKTRVTVNFGCTHTKDMDLNTLQDVIAETYTKALANGTLAGQADLVFHDKRTVAASANDDIDLTTLTDGFGQTVNLKKVRALVIVNLSASQALSVGAAATNAWTGPFGSATDKVNIPAGGILTLTAPDLAGFAVGASSKVLRIANGAGGSADFKFFVVGTSA